LRARRFPSANAVYSLEGGTEDNDLWVELGHLDDGTPFIRSLWELDEDDRKEIQEGCNVSLVVLGTQTPPVMVVLTEEQPGKDEE
jgi:hypothetical protein